MAAPGKYHVIKKITIPGDYGWDYLTADSEGRRLYVSHDNEVVVLDLDSGATVGRYPAAMSTASQWRENWGAALLVPTIPVLFVPIGCGVWPASRGHSGQAT